jgi:hypothetical protein
MSCTIPLSRGKVSRIDPDDYEWLNQWNWFCATRGYAVRNTYDRDAGKWRTVYMHRLILDAQPGQIVDHINGDPLDNRRENLRLATPGQNMHNRKPTSTPTSCPQYKGVGRRASGRYHAYISVKGKMYYLGTYDEAKTAALIYDAAARRYFGRYARLNHPEVPTTPQIEKQLDAGLSKHKPGPSPQPPKVPKGTSPYRGVHWDRGRWRGRVYARGRCVHVGYFEDDEVAARAVDLTRMALDPYNDLKLNFPDEWAAYRSRLLLAYGKFPVDVEVFLADK